jgi:tetratricopeptide (TPR) repeat protein
LRNLEKIKDLDLVGTEEDVALFRARHRNIIKSEQRNHGHRQAFSLVDGQPINRVEIDVEQSESDRMFPDLCTDQVEIMGFKVGLPPLEVLYLIKRAHANVAVHYDKTIRDLLQLKPLIGEFSEAQQAFYEARKRECHERYQLNRQRFKLAIKNEDFFDNSDHIRFYVHDDLHEVVAHHDDGPLYKKCKRDLSLARIDVDLFEKLSHEDQLRMVQEEFMVIGLERFFFHDRSLSPPQVYEKGMHKTMRDLFVGYFQDFCIDHVDELVIPPPFDFLDRFVKAEREGRLRQVQIKIDPPGEIHKQIWDLIQAGDFNRARQMSEDLIRRRAEHGIDTHAYLLLGVTLFRTGKLKEAENCLRRCLMRDKQNALACFFLGSTLRSQGRLKEAVQVFNLAAKMGFRKFPVLWNLGLAYEGLDMPDKAIAAYRQAHKLHQNDPGPRERLAALGAPLT